MKVVKNVSLSFSSDKSYVLANHKVLTDVTFQKYDSVCRYKHAKYIQKEEVSNDNNGGDSSYKFLLLTI